MKRLFILFCLIISSFTAVAQYEVKTVKRPDGITLNYFNPIPVARVNKCDAGLSLYKNPDNNNYFVAISVVFKNTVAEELNGNLMIQTTGKNGISLEPIYNKLVTMNGREVAASMYYLTERDINELKSNPIKLISFNVNDEIIALNLTENRDVLVNEFSILNNKEVLKTQTKGLNVLKQPKKEDLRNKAFLQNTGKLKISQDSNFDKLKTSQSQFLHNTSIGESKDDKDLRFADLDQSNIEKSVNEHREQNQFTNNKLLFVAGIFLIIFVIIFLVIFKPRYANSEDSANDKPIENNFEPVIDKSKNNITPKTNGVDAVSELSTDQNANDPSSFEENKPVIEIINDNPTEIISKPEPTNKELKRIGFKPSIFFVQTEPYNYPMVKMPKENTYIKFPRIGRSNKLGFTENTFFEVLNKYFKSDFKIYNDRHIPHKNGNNAYEPDLLLINEKENKNIFINIEIDEPYDGISRIPTHEINRDVYRDLFFINRGYIVIRFTEKQVFEEAKQCCVFIAKVIQSIDENYSNEELDFKTSISSQNQWDTLQAKKWSFEKYREKYLGIESFNPKSSSQIDFLIENSELDKIIESKIIEVDLSAFDKNDNKPLNGNQSHTRDSRIVFDPINHRYYIDNNPDTISVSQLIDKFFPEFDALQAATNLNPKHELYGLPTDEIISIWKKKGVEAAELGTQLHLQIESYYKKQRFKSSTKEFGYFLDFKAQFASMNPERTEWRIFDEDYRIAGTIDMLYKKEDGTFYVFDWKRSEKVVYPDGKLIISDPEHFYTKFAFGELRHLTDDSYHRYALQQNIYRHILETKYNCVISSMNLLILHPNYETYHWVKLPKMQKEVDYMFSTLKQIT